MKRILVVIDMQEGTTRGGYFDLYLDLKWWKRYKKVVARIKTLTQRMDSLFQIHTGFRQSEFLGVIPELKSIATNVSVIFKRQDDGSLELSCVIPKKTHIYVCGMNSDACVIRTVRGLAAKGYTVTVVGDACWSVYAATSPNPHWNALRAMRRSGIEIIKTGAVR